MLDFVILGSGPAGMAAAIRAAQLGQGVCVVERDRLGGVCLNRGCIPTKMLLRSAGIFSQIKRARDWGIDTKGASFDFNRILARKDRVVNALRKGMQDLYNESGVEVVSGRGRLKGQNEVEVVLSDGGLRSLKAARIILATGSSPVEHAALPVDGHRVVTSDHALRFESIPKSIIIVGGGYIGCEFGYIFNEFGSDVILIECLNHLLGDMDADIGKALAKEFTRSGIRVMTGESVADPDVKEEGVCVHVAGEVLTAEKLLVCTGRSPNTSGLGLEDTGVRINERGHVEVDEHCLSSIPDVYAAGDVTARGQLANVAHRQGVVAVESALGLDSKMDYRTIPRCVFTQPEVAAVGIGAREAGEAGLNVKTGIFEFRQLSKAWVSADTGGFVKLTVEASSHKILGVHMLGPYASFLIGEAALAVKTGARLEDLAASMPVHPSFSESLAEAARKLLGRGM
ncbi:MAG: dihydrolipoyl dehydrogenase [Candidatus Brocadiales bacterium]|nr:dihydrolipoyl dehydrogenase [Candidatus Bathyanammoxibius amoris]